MNESPHVFIADHVVAYDYKRSVGPILGRFFTELQQGRILGSKTADGRVLTGLIARETSDTVYVQQQTGDPVLVPRGEIEEITPSTVSIMPNGLEQALSETELADVIAYLANLIQPRAVGADAVGDD